MNDMVDLAFGTDVLKRVMHYMREFDPLFELPEGFFPADPKETQANGDAKVNRDDKVDSKTNGHTEANGTAEVGAKTNGQAEAK
jgi:hypothetical protein